jgi:DNA-binding transcriptional regulator YhcF (GntR family)
MLNEIITKSEPLDQDWENLILEALEMGISVEEIKAFLHQSKD